MKKIILSLLMLCTMVSAWSQTTETVTITCGGTNDSPFTVNAQSGSDGADGTRYWLVRSGNNLKLNVQQGYYVTKVEFETTDSYNNVDECDKLSSQGKAWVRDDNATGSDITLMPSYNKAEASTENVLLGTDVAKTLGADQYALSLGQEGVGFYLWKGKEIGANKAYLTLGSSAGAKAFTFEFENGETTGILKPVMDEKTDGPAYNPNGIRVNDNYKGIVIKNGKKIYKK